MLNDYHVCMQITQGNQIKNKDIDFHIMPSLWEYGLPLKKMLVSTFSYLDKVTVFINWQYFNSYYFFFNLSSYD